MFSDRGLGDDAGGWAIAVLERPSAISPRTSCSRGGEPGTAGRGRRQQLADHSGSMTVRPSATWGSACDELGDVADPVLEQVTEPGRRAESSSSVA